MSNRVLILPPFLRVTFSVAEHAPDHLRLDRARGNRVYADAFFSEFQGGTLAQAVDGVLAGHINTGSGQTDVTRDGRGVDDRSSAIARAAALPIPDVPPVTTATLFSSDLFIFMPFIRGSFFLFFMSPGFVPLKPSSLSHHLCNR